MSEQQNQSSFPDAVMLAEGYFAGPRGCMVHTDYVDLSGRLTPDGLCLAKATEPQFELSSAKAIRLSRPGKFRSTGEVLVRDEREGWAKRENRRTVAETEAPETARRVAAVNAGLGLGDAKIRVDASERSRRTNTESASLTFGKDWLIYCTSTMPPADEEEAWRRTFPASYTAVSSIHRPTQFAQALGAGVCEHIGATGKPAPVKATFHGFRTMERERIPQVVLHGPVLYVDDPYRCIDGTEQGWPRICSMIFVKSREYAAQREYRFAVLSVPPEAGEVFDLPMSGMLRDCLEPPEDPAGAAGSVNMSVDGSGVKPQETIHGYTYRRTRTQRETVNTRGDEPGSAGMKEVVVDETVTSPEEIPEPFPPDEQPDVIVVDQVAGQARYIHRAYEETTHWRIESMLAESALVENDGANAFARMLEVPPELRLAAQQVPPVDPGHIIELFRNPSVPKPPRRDEGLDRLDRADLAHVLACQRALGGAVEQVPELLRERAAASAWYAALFIEDVVRTFGPVVKSVCVIVECVAVVELERAPLSGSVAWGTFSGAGTWSLHLRHRAGEDVIHGGRRQRASPMTFGTYVDALEEHGWGSRRESARWPRAR